MSLKRFGREMLLAAGLLAGGGKEAIAQETPKQPEAAGSVEAGDQKEEDTKVQAFRAETLKILSSLYPGADAENVLTRELDEALAKHSNGSTLEQLRAIDDFAKAWLKADAEKRKAGGKADLDERHKGAQEHKEWFDSQLKKFLDPKVSFEEARQILQEIVPEGATINSGRFNFKRDQGSNDIYLDGRRVDEKLRRELIDAFSKK